MGRTTQKHKKNRRITIQDLVSIMSTESESACSPRRPLMGDFPVFGLLVSELSSLLSGLPGWLLRRETRLRVICSMLADSARGTQKKVIYPKHTQDLTPPIKPRL